ncbi:hypothetical protein [Spongiactinospora sp. TRM90649]|uniref:hypothetical protein n=1 Tax=Spongiactinospora sp. TRM90649 TaxID=3031114 RepID=UPI0023F88D8D|nr:hypothetical protein [Spongiactinospora sp. TRM90649]MDF5758049.1 hypothetical protein [Spongiactinospora sp. TRM90649]
MPVAEPDRDLRRDGIDAQASIQGAAPDQILAQPGDHLRVVGVSMVRRMRHDRIRIEE